jgi:dienelactone hydrolase
MKKIFVFMMIILLTGTIFSCDRNKDEFKYVEEKISITSGNFKLDGILTMPKSDALVPAVILISGSGPNNYDSSIGKLTPFRDIAVYLAKNGIASIRYNKVTYQHYSDIRYDYSFTLKDEYLDSANGALDYIFSDPRIDQNNIYVIGHSQGGQFVPVLVNSDERIKGSIIMAGTSMHLIDLMMEQYLSFYGESVYNENLPYALEAMNITLSDSSKYNHFYFGAYHEYWVYYNSINYENELIRAANKPMLILHGKLDLQIGFEHFEKYQELLKGYETVNFKWYEKLNHFFIDAGIETIETAYQETGSVAVEVMEDIVNFIKK